MIFNHIKTLQLHTRRFLIKALIFLLIFSFLLVSLSTIFESRNNEYVIRVGHSQLSLQQWQALIKRKEYGNLNNKWFTTSQKIQLSEKIINKFILYEEAKKLGITVTDSMIKKEILKMSYFFHNNKFNYKLFNKILEYSGITEDEFINEVKMMITIQIFLNSFTNNGIALPFIVSNVLEEIFKTREVQLLEIPFQALNIQNATLQDLLKIFIETKPIMPAEAYISYALIDPIISIKNIISDQNIKKSYQANKKILKTEEERMISQIYFKSFEDAQMSIKALQLGRSFQNIAKQYSPKVHAIYLGAVKINDFNTEVGQEIFKVNKGGITNIIETSFGFYIFKINDIVESRTLTLDQLKDKIALTLVEKEQEKKTKQDVQKIQHLIKHGYSFNKITEKFQLQVFNKSILQNSYKLFGNIKETRIMRFLFNNAKTVNIFSIDNSKYYIITNKKIKYQKTMQFIDIVNKLEKVFFSRILFKEVQRIYTYLNKQNKIEKQMFNPNKHLIKNVTLFGNKKNNKLSAELLFRIYNTRNNEHKYPYIDYLSKTVFFIQRIKDLSPKKTDREHLKKFYTKEIASIENEEIKNLLLIQLRKRYKKKIYKSPDIIK